MDAIIGEAMLASAYLQDLGRAGAEVLKVDGDKVITTWGAEPARGSGVHAQGRDHRDNLSNEVKMAAPTAWRGRGDPKLVRIIHAVDIPTPRRRAPPGFYAAAGGPVAITCGTRSSSSTPIPKEDQLRVCMSPSRWRRRTFPR